jgi:hypothetical protein
MVGIDSVMDQLPILEILNEVCGDKAFADAAFAVNDEVDLFFHGVGLWTLGWLEVAGICDARPTDPRTIRGRSCHWWDNW